MIIDIIYELFILFIAIRAFIVYSFIDILINQYTDHSKFDYKLVFISFSNLISNLIINIFQLKLAL